MKSLTRQKCTHNSDKIHDELRVTHAHSKPKRPHTHAVISVMLNRYPSSTESPKTDLVFHLSFCIRLASTPCRRMTKCPGPLPWRRSARFQRKQRKYTRHTHWPASKACERNVSGEVTAHHNTTNATHTNAHSHIQMHTLRKGYKNTHAVQLFQHWGKGTPQQ